MFWVLYHIIFRPSFTLSHLPLLHSYHYLHLIHYHCFLPLLHSVIYLIINIGASFASPNHFYLSSFPPFFIIIINLPLIHSQIHNIASFVFWGIATSHALLIIFINLINIALFIPLYRLLVMIYAVGKRVGKAKLGGLTIAFYKVYLTIILIFNMIVID